MSDRTAHEEIFWSVEQLWKGETAFCLASGPSLTQGVADKVKGQRAIVVNSSYTVAPWADVLFFTDGGWFEKHTEVIKSWPGMVVTVSRKAKRELPDHVRRAKGVRPIRGGFPAIGNGEIRQGRSSGHTAVGLAVAMGAKRVVLLGYDMRVVGDREHHHTEYLNGRPRNLGIYANEFVPAFNGWNAEALALGVEILNATPDSAVLEFPFVELDRVIDALNCDRHHGSHGNEPDHAGAREIGIGYHV